MNREFDTIAAICTGLTESGISVIRISGPDSIEAADRIFKTASGLSPSAFRSNRMHLGQVINEDGSILDEAMCCVFRAPHSYTAEDCVEIQCHGGIRVTGLILSLILSGNVRQAERGEFTKRAFLNGRIDLSQAESVMSLVSAVSDRGVSVSASGLLGVQGERIREIREKIRFSTAHIEAALDDPDEITYSPDDLLSEAEPVLLELKKVSSSSKVGKLLESGVDTVIAGLPNSGKSSLMNFLAGEETSIVTDIPGTTRDVVRARITLDGDIVLNLADTAGLRDSDDPIEKLGVEKSYAILNNADLVLFLVDGSVAQNEENMKIYGTLGDKKTVTVVTKADLPAAFDIDSAPFDHRVSFSSVTGQGLTELRSMIRSVLDMDPDPEGKQAGLMILTSRQETLINRAISGLENAIASCGEGVTEDLYVSHLYDAYGALSEFLGEEVGDDIIDEIFRSFCMGK